MADESNDGVEKILPISTPIDRGRGCWNCMSWENQEKSREEWSHRRQRDLKFAMEAMAVTKTEKEGLVYEVKSMVNKMDHLVALGAVGICQRGASETDFVHHGYLCDQWTAKIGVEKGSIEGEDKLPEELMQISKSKREVK
jgi:hypothetical protein